MRQLSELGNVRRDQPQQNSFIEEMPQQFVETERLPVLPLNVDVGLIVLPAQLATSEIDPAAVTGRNLRGLPQRTSCSRGVGPDKIPVLCRGLLGFHLRGLVASRQKRLHPIPDWHGGTSLHRIIIFVTVGEGADIGLDQDRMFRGRCGSIDHSPIIGAQHRPLADRRCHLGITAALRGSLPVPDVDHKFRVDRLRI